MENNLISRQAAIEAIEVLKRNYPSSCFAELCNAVDIAIKALSAEPEIIRCKDCDHFIDYRCREKHSNIRDWRDECDYCSYAERRTDE